MRKKDKAMEETTESMSAASLPKTTQRESLDGTRTELREASKNSRRKGGEQSVSIR